MKNLKTLLLITVITLGLNSSVNAQKIGHVNSIRVLANMPETRAATVELEKTAKTHSGDIVAMKKKGENKITKYRAEASAQTEETNAQRAQEIQVINLKLQELQKTAQETLGKKEATLMAPIYEKLQKTLEEVAKAKGLLYILDTSKGSVIVANGTDIYEDLKVKLGLLKDQQAPK